MFEEPLIGWIKAPNITTILPDYTDAELERLIRRGVKRDGRSVFVMPSRFLHQLDDARLTSIIAHIRSLPRQENRFKGGVKFGPMGRVFLAIGEFQPSAAEVDPDSPRKYLDLMDETGLGQFWATTVCSECHGEDLRGEEGFTPSLEVVATAYTRTDFELLLRTGLAIGGRKAGLMSEIARDNLRHLTAREVAGLYDYLTGHFAADTAVAE
jgi:cytochrome c553